MESINSWIKYIFILFIYLLTRITYKCYISSFAAIVRREKWTVKMIQHSVDNIKQNSDNGDPIEL